MEGVVEGQRREGEEGQKKGRERREGINGGGWEGQRRGEALKNKQVQEGGGERRGEEEGKKETGWKKRGKRWQIVWLATIAVARGTKARYCYVGQPKYLL